MSLLETMIYGKVLYVRSVCNNLTTAFQDIGGGKVEHHLHADIKSEESEGVR